MGKIFPIGATYAPLPKATEVDIEEWAEDLHNFKKLGLNTFRLFICWDRIAKSEYEHDFSKVDYAFELAEKFGLKVIVNVGGTFANLQAIYPPRWLVYDKQCTLLKAKPDADNELHFNRFKLCYDDPTFQMEAEKFIKKAVTRYKGHPSLLAWSGWNEPRLSECYCHHTIDLYRNHLKGKYNDLEHLGKAWSSEFPVFFRSWEDVFPQPVANFENGGYVPFIEWHAFREKNRTDKFHMILNSIKSVDASTPVISHMCGARDADIFGREDILGTSIYTIHAQGRSQDYRPYEFTQSQKANIVSIGKRNHRKDPHGFWVVETEGGPVSWVHDLVPRSYSPRKMNARDMLLVAHGARALLRWLFRSRVSDAQAGEFNMLGWDGRITERALEFGKLAEFLNGHADLFLSHVPDNQGVYILTQRDYDALASCEGYMWRYSSAEINLNSALSQVGVNAETCNLRQIDEGILDGARILFIPFLPHLSENTANILRAFVKDGGCLVAESPFAIKDLLGRHYQITPGALCDVFGVRVYDMEKLEDQDCGGIPGCDFRAKIDVVDARVERCFSNGDPALTIHRYGQGNAVLYASIPSVAYQLEEPFHQDKKWIKPLTYADGASYREELIKHLGIAGIIPGWRVSGIADDSIKNIQIITRRLPVGGKLAFVLNMDDKPKHFNLMFSDAGNIEELGSSDVDCVINTETALVFSLKEWGWSVLRMT